MNAMRQLFILLLCFITLGGCSAIKQAVLNTFQDQPHEIYREKAMLHEKQGEFQQALFAWRVAARLNPKDKEIPVNIKTLEENILKASDAYYTKGIADYQKGNLSGARNHFLIALRIMPGHKGALRYLKTRLPNSGNTEYKVVRGDSYSKIATDAYNDPTKAFVIAFFNGLDPQKPLLIGTDLLLPELSPKTILPRKDLDALAQRAKSAIEKQRYREALQIVSEIETQQPGHPQINELKDTVYFQRGMTLLDQKKYVPAIAQLKQVSPGHAGRDQAIASARKHLATEATDAKLVQAQLFLDEKSYAEAIAVCEEMLTQDPFNKKANAIFYASHYAWGKALLEEEKEAEAINVLSVLGQGYQDTAQLLAQARARLNARAEALYRKGVRLFLNEDLEKAISAWEQALKLNPDHPKARQDSENAMRLLDKWRDLDQQEDNAVPSH